MDVDVTIENVVEDVIQKQMLAVNGLKHSVEGVQGTTPTSIVKGFGKQNVEFVGERLKLLEDASHRQLEVLEALIDAVQGILNNSGLLLTSLANRSYSSIKRSLS